MAIPNSELLKALKAQLTVERRERIESVASQRTRKISLILEDIQQEHNTGALLRTADILGIQDVHLVSQEYEARLAKAIAKGSTNWVDLHRYQERDENNLAHCLAKLKGEGYQLLVADPDGDFALPELEFTGQPMAVLMGAEGEGVSEQAKAAADLKVSIPQYGFTQSFNVSVAAALILQQLTTSMRRSGFDWRLEEEERTELELAWTMKRLGHSAWPLRDKIEADWLKEN